MDKDYLEKLFSLWGKVAAITLGAKPPPELSGCH